jgi:cytochrome P450
MSLLLDGTLSSGAALCGIDMSCHRLLQRIMDEFANFLRFFAFYDQGSSERNRLYHKAKADLWAFFRDIIAQKRQSGFEHGDSDLLELLITAQDQDDEAKMLDDELLQNLFLLFLAGHETSSTTLNFVLIMLGMWCSVMVCVLIVPLC